MTNNNDDFEIVNGKRILKDGRRLVVPQRFMDSADNIQRELRESAEGGIWKPQRVRGFNDSNLSLHQPGMRLGVGPDAGEQAFMVRDKMACYDAYDQQVRSAWQNPPTGQGSHNLRWPPPEGSLCTINGRRGHTDANGVCIPDDQRRDAADLLLNEPDDDECPYCEGTGRRRPSENDLDDVVTATAAGVEFE